MVPFFLTLESDNKALSVTAEQLQGFADVDGYCRYDITAGDRRSVIYVNVGYEEPPMPVIPQGAVHYSEYAQAYAETDDDLFTIRELNLIAAAIREHNRESGISFPEFNFDL